MARNLGGHTAMTERLSHIWIRIAMPMLLAIGFFAAVSVTQSAGEENTAIRIGCSPENRIRRRSPVA